MAQEKLCGKLKMTAKLRLETGLHIGGSDEFAPIGAVDSAVIRDPYTKEPIIPGSSMKGKIRSLLRRNQGGLNLETESPVVKRLFGTADKREATPARLQFVDSRMAEDSVKAMEQMDMDTYLGEIKFENTINPLTGEANPRQIERVPAGTIFDFQLIYNISDIEQVTEDLQTLADGIRLLTWDYLGGHGSRGYGRVTFSQWDVQGFSGLADTDIQPFVAAALQFLKEV
ncbi:type III-A CRISPR-associated RAMP protein Csm3 [uncultured Megasphaera sp.]|uniref:type III-A CRISPR-associated RAMP protein Csm3 n=1 Tax=uncultured Megasphaera sp. TaxID=165188 RepID=UPI00262B641C|nr:type III-A CRISPR-associated RAMP protein Csm3 [uncultured Megasphaera sp.]